MKVAVWDTYVEREDGLTMHFDILVPESEQNQHQVFAFGDEYLKQKSFTTGKISTKECAFCHIEKASPEVVSDIQNKGYSIVEMKNCN